MPEPFGAYLHRRGGKLHSVDLSPSNVAFAREWTQVFGDTVTVHERDSLSFLSELQIPTIDLAYLDSLDTTEPGHAEHAFREVELVLPKLHTLRPVEVRPCLPFSTNTIESTPRRKL